MRLLSTRKWVLAFVCFVVGLFLVLSIFMSWNLTDECNCMIFTTDKILSAPSVLIKTVGTFSNESHLATFSTLSAEFLLGERAAVLPTRTAYHRGNAQAQQSLWFRDIKSKVSSDHFSGLFLFFWQRDFLCPSKLFNICFLLRQWTAGILKVSELFSLEKGNQGKMS